MKRRFVTENLGYYYIFSKLYNDLPDFNTEEKFYLRDLMWNGAEYFGIRILTYCIMSRELYILAEIPKRMDIDNHKLLKKMKKFYGVESQIYRTFEWQLKNFAKDKKKEQIVNMLREKERHRMCNLPAFMQSLKQDFSHLYHQGHGHKGSVWHNRYQSHILCAPRGKRLSKESRSLLRTVGLFMDLYPLTEGLVANPSEYNWNGHAQACAGYKPAQDGQHFLRALKSD